jgi:hypothetical protein
MPDCTTVDLAGRAMVFHEAAAFLAAASTFVATIGALLSLRNYHAIKRANGNGKG